MQELLQRDDLFELVVSGVKKSTVRKGVRDITEGPLVIKATESGKTKEVNVTDVEFVKYSDLNEQDAETNGFQSLNDFKTTLTEIYGELESDQDITIVYWD
jgi:hypothetical protein